jgi:hypothetical protein
MPTFLTASIKDNCDGKVMNLVKNIEFGLVGKDVGTQTFTLSKNEIGEYSKRISDLSKKSVAPYQFLRVILKSVDDKEIDSQYLELSKATKTDRAINLDFVFDCKKANVPKDTNDLISENISSGTENKSQTVTATNNSNKSQVNQNLPTKKNKTWLYVLLGATALFGIYYFYQKKK